MGRYTEYNRAMRIFASLRDIYSRARSYHSPHWKILEDLRALRTSKDYQKLTTYYLGQFAGIHDELRNNLYRYDLEWRLYLDGRLVTSKEIPDGAWNRVKGGEHVWSADPARLFSSIVPLNPPHLSHKPFGGR